MVPPRGRVWPMALPYPEMHSQRRRGTSEEIQLKLGLNFLILTLDWLAMGERLADVRHLSLGSRLNSKQWEVVHRFAPLVKSWNEHGTVDSNDMGRAAVKVESIESVIASLEEVVSQQTEEFGSYSRGRGGCRGRGSAGWGPAGHPGEVVGWMGKEVEHVAKEVEPDRYKFHERPTFNAEDFLDAENRAKFLRPLDFAAAADPNDAALPRVKVRASSENKLRLLETLDRTGRLALVQADLTEKGFENGLFSIPKDAEKDRMVLDARRANSREDAEKRWIYSLGSVAQLQHLFIGEDETLVLHAEDLREYYHAFKISDQRMIRNALKMKVFPSQVSHLGCFREELYKFKELVPCLNTLAMGDLNAVAFGQAAHLAVLLRGSSLRLEDFITLKTRPSRKRIRAGLMIDDFVLFETVSNKEYEELQEGKKSRGAIIVEEVREAYERAGLPRHPGKAVEQSATGECWGLQIDGQQGWARPNLKRVIPLANVILKILRCGQVSVGLLEVVSGALCSVFQTRRRLMSILHEVYAAQKDRQKGDIVRMSSQLKDELMMCVPLLACAIVDMRLEPSEKLIATDASSKAEAGVFANIGKQRTSEFQRFGLQKGLWNRLMAPEKAYLREREAGIYEEDQLPDEQYSMHPLWREVVQCCSFEAFGPVVQSDRREHINLKELSAALQAEKRQGRSEPNTFYVHLQDSQVSLACLVKGRSSSWAVNSKLRKSIPESLANNNRAFYGYVRSALNPADDPTRGETLRQPSSEFPHWWREIEEGCFEKFDSFLHKEQVGIMDMAELPSEDELMESWDFDQRRSKDLKCERGRMRRKKKEDEQVAGPQEPAAEEGQAGTHTSEAPKSRCGGSCPIASVVGVSDQEAKDEKEGECRVRAEAADAEEERDREKAEAVMQSKNEGRQKTQKSCSGREHGCQAERVERKLRSGFPAERLQEPGSKKVRLSEKAKNLLLGLPSSQFVIGAEFATVEEALEEGPGLLDLFSGQRGFAEALVRRGAPWAVCWDLKHSLLEDVLKPRNMQILRNLLSWGAVRAMAAGPVCASFSTAITPPWRTLEHPRGVPWLNETQLEKIECGHAQLLLVLELCRICLRHSVHFWVENPDGSWFWKQRDELDWTPILDSGKVGDYRTDQCFHGTPWRKRTKFRTTTQLQGTKQMCRRQTNHIRLRGRCKLAKQNFTKLAESYPRKLCDYLACAVAADCGWQPKRQRVSSAAVAKCGHLRVGEAKNPGPRRPRAVRTGTLDDFQLLEPQTVQMRKKLWDEFTKWVEKEFGTAGYGRLLGAPIALVKTLEAYGHVMFSAGVPLHYYRQLLAHAQREYVLTRPYMSQAWALVSRWEVAEPIQHRTPIPEPLLRAISCLAIAWGWPNFATAAMTAFYGICRMGEVLKADRHDLLTPTDLLVDDGVVYLQIRAPKTRNKSARIQYTTVTEPLAVKLIEIVWQGLHHEARLVPFSASAFRRRWDALLLAVGLDQRHRLTPGSLRGGGAVSAHKSGMQVQDLMWKMRLGHQKTLSHYLQETTAVSVLPLLTPEKRSTIQCLHRLLPFYIEALQKQRFVPNVTSAHGFSWLAT